MYCTRCGAEVSPDAKFCPICGAKIENNESKENEYFDSSEKSSIDKSDKIETISILALVFSFVAPLVGLILGIVGSNKNYNKRNSQFCKVAIAISIVLLIFNMIFGYQIRNYILNWFNYFIQIV